MRNLSQSQSSARTSNCNLLLISRPSVNELADFAELSEWIHEIDPRIHVHVLPDQRFPVRKWLLAMRRTMLFSPVKCNHFRVARGAVYQGNPLSKSAELEALQAAGVAIPDFAVLTDQNPTADLSHWGEYVVVKPDRGGRGANVRIMRSAKVRWEPLDTRIAGKSPRVCVQRFIYTGGWPVSYRVTTLFGQVLWALKVEASRTRPPLSGPEAFKNTPGLSVVSNSKGCTFALEQDPEIIAFAEQAHRAFPTVPLLGIDVIREQPGGKLYVLEVNASGLVWHFTSPLGKGVQRDFGINLEGQFDGRRKAARILAAKAMEMAM